MASLFSNLWNTLFPKSQTPTAPVVNQSTKMHDWIQNIFPPPPTDFNHFVVCKRLSDFFSENEKTLDLTRLGLVSLPSELLYETNIHKNNHCLQVDCSYNRLEALPINFLKSLCNSESLEILLLQSNYLRNKEIFVEPSFKQAFAGLKVLDLSHNMITCGSACSLSIISETVPYNFSWISYLPVSLEKLNLRGNPLSCEVPKDLGKLVNLVLLDLGGCYVTYIPESIGECSKLNTLLLDSNELSVFPSGIKGCTNLEILNLAHNRVVCLPETIGDCTKLVHLDLSGNLLCSLPDSIAQFTKLHSLLLSPNAFTDFPTIICSLFSLEKLSFGGMKANTLPDGLSSLNNLQELNIRYNSFADIPEVLFDMPNLTHLDISGNNIESLSSKISSISSLRFLNVADNPLNTNANTFLLLQQLPSKIPTLERVYTDSGRTPELVTPIILEPLKDRILGLFFGAAIGDAIGLATEFLTKSQASFYYGQGPLDFDHIIRDRHRKRWTKGDWTDDTDQMILLLDNLIENKGQPNPQTFAKSLLRWAHEGFSILGDTGGMGIGSTVSSVLQHEDFLTSPHKASREIWAKRDGNAAANGAVMRTSVLGIPSFENTSQVVDNTLAMCKLHFLSDPRCCASCVLVTVTVAALLRDMDYHSAISEGLQEASKVLLQAVESSQRDRSLQELDYYANVTELQALELADSGSIGYTYKTMGSGLWALRQKDFEYAITSIVLEAGDADTNGAVAGALLGCKLGFSKLPAHWLREMPHVDWLMEKIDTFIQQVVEVKL